MRKEGRQPFWTAARIAYHCIPPSHNFGHGGNDVPELPGCHSVFKDITGIYFKNHISGIMQSSKIFLRMDNWLPWRPQSEG